MTFAFHPEAEAEFFDFSNEIYSTVQQVVNHPAAWPVLEDDVAPLSDPPVSLRRSLQH